MKKFWPIIVIILVELGIVVTNVTPQAMLAGWDNLFPEFNFPLNTIRSIFGVWLEYRGTGLYDGMSHIANLVHTLTIWVMSFVFPRELLRYVFTFSMHVLGGIGAYALITHLFDKRDSPEKNVLGFIGALFYMLNLATVQMFFAPLEAYSVYFASLPWLAWGLLKYYAAPTRKTYVLFLVISLLSTPAFFVTTLLLPVTLVVGTLSLTYLFKNWRVYARRVLIAAIGFLLINAFWLLPYLWGLPQNAPVIANAKINQMGSGEIFARNQAFGDIANVLMLRGFTLDFEDLDQDGVSIAMMDPWRSFLETPVAGVISGLIAVTALIGLTALLAKPKQRAVGFAITFLTGFVLLSTDTPGIREVTVWLQNTLPFFKEAFRFTFTKFSLPFALSYTVLFVSGIQAMAGHKPSKYVFLAVVGIAVSGILYLSLPAFQGNFLYHNLRIALPNDYTELFAYAQTLDPHARMAILPQPTYWSWKQYRFGYRGSGFLWMGMPQPTLDRAFDPWSKTNEGYYWEVSYALYSKNAAMVNSVFDKYDIAYIVLDENILSFSNNRSLFIDETKALLAAIPGITKTKTFGKLSVYEKTGGTEKSFVSFYENLPTVNPYSWTDNDVAFAAFGSYITGDTGVQYPYRSLFTKRSAVEREFDINSILPLAVPVYDSTASADLVPAHFKECGLLKPGNATATMVSGSLRLESTNQRGCLSFDIPDLSHKNGYLVGVESTHVTGRPLMISLINNTARHVELETFLENTTDYFVLPPLAPDGLGYTVYVSNDAIGRETTVNNLTRIRMYTIPYNDIVTTKTSTPSASIAHSNFSLSHPNPALYTVETNDSGTLVLSQSFDPGWIALNSSTKEFLPHVRVDNWKNGWIVNPGTNGTIYILFWPQLLEFLGFLLLPIPFIYTRKLS